MATPADNPISDASEDKLGRHSIAAVIAREIRLLDATEGYVVGVLGPWGAGKTSLMNMVRQELGTEPAIPVVDFNPWMFSGTDELVESFFLEISAQFRNRTDRLGELAKEVEAYGEILAPLRLLPVLGVWFERARSASSAIRRAHDRRKGGVLAQRAKLAGHLAELTTPVVIVIDDIDRLRTSEIRDIFKLVRLTANFPNIVYVLAFDRDRVEKALSEDGLPGRDYLEKILQVSWDLPRVPRATLTELLVAALNDSLSDIDNAGPFDERRWPDVLAEIIDPLIRNVRDIRRYAAAIHGTVQGLDGEVALVDVLGLEAVRTFLPDVFRSVVDAEQALTSTGDAGYGREAEANRLKATIERLVDHAGDRADLARSLVTRIFPAAGRHINEMSYGSSWLREWLHARRVAHPELLRFYLERVAGQELQAFQRAERLFPAMGDEDHFQAEIEALEGDALAETIAALEVYEEEFPPESVVPASAVLLNVVHRVPERGAGLIRIRPEITVDRVVLRLLRRLESAEEIDVAVRAILQKLNSLSAQWQLIQLVGYRDGAGHELISEESAKELEAQLRTRVGSSSPEALAGEPGLLWLLSAVVRDRAPDEPPLELREGPPLDEALISAAASEVVAQAMGSRSVSRRNVLHWETLVTIVGGEDGARHLLDRLEARLDLETDVVDLVAVGRRYLSGWRPEHDR